MSTMSTMFLAQSLFVCLCYVLLLASRGEADSDHMDFDVDPHLDATDGVKIEIIEKPEECTEKAKENDFLTLHFSSKWENGEVITSTYDRGIPVEIQLGTRMLSPGLDEGLRGICIGEKRRLLMPANLGVVEPIDGLSSAGDGKGNIVYEVELLSISEKTTGNTFKYLDLNSDNKISTDEAESLVKMFMKALSADIPGIDVKQLVTFFMSLHDKDGDMFISESEFLDSVQQNSDVLNDLGRDEL